MRDWENEFMINFQKLVRDSKHSLKSISKATGIPNSTLNNWMHEKTSPRFDWRVLALAKFFKKPLEYFLESPDLGNGLEKQKPKRLNKTQLDLFQEIA
jgi:hypothetical protein